MYDPRGFLDLARFINGDPAHQQEGFLRSGVSRAYYYAHLRAREQLVALGYLPRKGRKTHAKVINVLRNCRPPSQQVLGHWLAALKDRREVADYQLKPNVGIAELKSAISLAEAIDNGLQSVQQA
jgi:uncharacterized protein (UPF0332 family)